MITINRSIIDATTARIQPKLADFLKLKNSRPGELNRKDPDRMTLRARFAAPTGAAPSRLDLERILGRSDLLDLNYFERGLRVARSVGRIIFLGPGGQARGYATGFMVSPRLLLTNHHVFKSAAEAGGAVLEFDYQLDGMGRPRPTERFRFRTGGQGGYFYNNAALDFALVAVDPVPLLRGTALADYGWLQMNPTLGKINEGEYVSIVQHPGGEPKQIAIRENQLVKLSEDGIHMVYLCDTAPGSSGSPVFNDSWQVVGLHHSGVPKKNAKGEWLGPDGKVAPPDAAENQIQWVANEGIRTSAIVKNIESSAPEGEMKAEFLEATKTDGGGAPAGHDGGGLGGEAPEAGGAGLPQTRITADGMLVTVPVSFRVQWAGAGVAKPAAAAPVAAPAVLASSAADAVLDEKKILDTNYKNRDKLGYDPDFLGIKVPLPTLSPAAMKDVSRRTDVGGKNNHIVPYYHFSLVMNAKRRVCFFTASNYSAEAKFRGELSRTALGDDKWDPDPRVPEADQVSKKEIYDGTDFDLGHIVRREDNYWGETEEEAVFANWDTFHLTNCTPQHSGFNQGGKGGIWGKLESMVAKQLKKQDDRLTQFAGPVLSNSDKMFRGVVPIPKQYWKVVVANDGGKLKAYGFLLSQAQLIKDMEADIVPDEEFQPFQVPLSKIEAITPVRFAPVVNKADVKG